jgi:hypothetical protein
LAGLGTVDPTSGQSPEWAQLREQVAEVRQANQQWAVKIVRRHWNPTRRTASFSIFASFDWTQTPDKQSVETITIAGEKLRYEQTQPRSDRSILIDDGRIARGRDPFRSVNGPLPSVAKHGFTLLIPGMPHALPAGLYYPPDLSWLFGEYRCDSRDEESRSPVTVGSANLSVSNWNEHPCWKMNWIELPNRACEAWLAKDRDLLPIRLRGSHHGETFTFEITDFQSVEGITRNIWHPKVIRGSYQHGTYVELVSVDLTPQPIPTDPNHYSKQPWFQPLPAALPAIGPDAPFVLAPQALAPPVDTAGWGGWIRSPIVLVGILFSLSAIVIGIAWLLLARHRYGRMIQSLARRLRRPLIVAVIVGTAVVAIACCCVPGWMHHGIAMVVTGTFGLLSVIALALLLGRKTFSIRSVLWLSFCVAMILAGYAQAFGRFHSRQTMTNRIRSAGGKVEITTGPQRPLPFYLPERLTEWFDDDLRSYVQSAVVPERLFTPQNVQALGLEEAAGIWVAPTGQEPFMLDGRAIDAIERTSSLEDIAVSGGRLGADSFRSLSRFVRLKNIRFDCFGESLPDELGGLRNLERITVDNPVIDDHFFQLLAGLPKLRSIIIHNAIGPRSVVTEAAGLKWSSLQIYRTKLSKNLLETFGSIEGNLSFKHCSINPIAPESLSMPMTNRLNFLGTDVNDSWLLSIGDSAKLKSIHVWGSSITAAGMESFSARHPDVVLSIRLTQSR